MTIAILPPRLANQIAAGEVVERPASVVKELVENSIDAGANKIVIDIEQGGHKRIRIIDNGKGIYQDQLSLALSRHATSKIKDLDDLESISSLGFRGEALASISSVSRLTLTSKPADQETAWRAMATGREMEVDIQPAAHPDGTTIDVEDLFFNTPARRKFLRTHKTEFSHIDEVIRRIALSKLDIIFTLNHNGKTVRQYRGATTDKQVEKRLASICSQAFVDNAIAIDFEHQGLHLFGWVANPNFSRNQNDLCYSYVNGRMMRDKLINHAIRQAYGERLTHDSYPAFVLFLNLDFDQVDVNVHPAKHEVRFHHARFVHDFIVSAISQSLQQDILTEHDSEQAGQTTTLDEHSDYRQPLRLQNADDQTAPVTPQSSTETNYSAASSQRFSRQSSSQRHFSDKPGKQALANYDKLLSTDINPNLIRESENTAKQSSRETSQVMPVSFGEDLASADYQVVKLGPKNTAVVLHQDTLFLLKTAPLNLQYQRLKMARILAEEVVSQPLLLPVAINLDNDVINFIGKHQQQFSDHGIELDIKPRGKCIIRQYPALLREQDIQSSFTQLLKILQQQSTTELNWLDCFAQLLCQPVATVAELQSIVKVLHDSTNLDFFALFDLNCIELDLTSYLLQLELAE
ncbi:DNA mismatch repair endonuclease MutL [Thalassotalea litorea]|uniref:DNA mismatch repair protein MutL n=1 Tax=Thalassotalea litorea TaxID=2020715 RepID=A0A5R9IP51_9GAMM|nr:DNA mismatch repair endonuclease MutL [Thalassotalea litorea]TLU65837.1 DNA mismatch repair endonuclease MutL [Thalassotalea litorea]